MTGKPGTIDEYLAPLDADKRAALEELRRMIRRIVPDALECISYGMPAFRHNGTLICFGAAKNHCALYGNTLGATEDDLEGFSVSNGTVRFRPDNPLPESLVRKLVLARVAEKA